MASALCRLAAFPILLFWLASAAAEQIALPVAPALFATTLLGLQDLKKDLQSTLALIDADSAARLRHLNMAADILIKELQVAIEDASADAKIDETKIYTDVFAFLSDVNNELGRKGYLAYAGANATLANVSAAMEGLPSLKAPTSLIATYPLRLSTAAADTSVTFFGHFPDIDAAHQPTVTYRVDGVPAETVPLRRSIGGGLSFQIPQAYLKEGQFVEMSVAIPQKTFALFYGTAIFPARVYVEKREALSLEISTYQENPKLWTVVPSPAEYIERADGLGRFNVGTASAAQLFSVLINDTKTYIADSAAFVSMPFRVSVVGAPCWCGCGGSSAALTSWDTNSVSWQISAPSCAYHFCSGRGQLLPQTQFCRGGETHAEIYLKPFFRVKLRNQRDDVLLYSQYVRMQRRDIWQSEALPSQWDNVAIVGTFKDGEEVRECRMTIFKDVRNGACDLFSVSATNDALTIESR